MSNEKKLHPFVQRVIAIREAKGMKQTHFAEEMGFSQAGWSRVENGGGKSISKMYYDRLVAAYPELKSIAPPPLTVTVATKRNSNKREFLMSLFKRLGAELSVSEYAKESKKLGIKMCRSYIGMTRREYRRIIGSTQPASNVGEVRVLKVADAAYQAKDKKLVAKPEVKLERRVPWTYARGIVSLATHQDAKTLFVGFLRAADAGGMTLKDVLNDLESV